MTDENNVIDNDKMVKSSDFVMPMLCDDLNENNDVL